MTIPVIIPAAGLGSRLGELTRHTPKELLVVGGAPALQHALDSLVPAGVTDLAVVVARRSDQVRDYVAAHTPPGVRLHLVTQPEPVGTSDAIERGRVALGVDRYLALFPDYLHVSAPGGVDPFGLRGLIDAAQVAPEATWMGLVRMTPERAARMGPTTRVATEPVQGNPGVHRITRAEPARPVRPGVLQTVYAEIRGPAHQALLNEGAFADADIWSVLSALAARGLYYGYELPGEVLDIGIPAGYAHAVEWGRQP